MQDLAETFQEATEFNNGRRTKYEKKCKQLKWRELVSTNHHCTLWHDMTELKTLGGLLNTSS